MRHRIRGYENDRAEFRRLELALDVIECPTLILHGSLDTEAPVAHAHFAHAKIANSQLVVFDGADHSMLASEYKDIVRRMTEFVLTNN